MSSRRRLCCVSSGRIPRTCPSTWRSGGWCAALLAQAQMVFALAALAGLSATDELRAADLLVLQGSGAWPTCSA